MSTKKKSNNTDNHNNGKKSDVDDSDKSSVRRSNRNRKATDFYIPEESVNCHKKSNKASTECVNSDTKTNKSKENSKSRTKQKKGRKAIGKLLYDYRNNKRKRTPDYQKRLKYVERDPSVDILHKKLGLVAQRLSAISEAEEA